MTLDIFKDINQMARGFMPALTHSIKTAIRGWHQKIMPGHFRSSAASKYGYSTRDAKYLRYKRRGGFGRKSGAPDLVYSGRSKRILSLPINPVGTKGNVQGKFASNSKMRYFFMTTPGHPNKPAELKATTAKERAAMNEYIKKMTVIEITKRKTIRRIK